MESTSSTPTHQEAPWRSFVLSLATHQFLRQVKQCLIKGIVSRDFEWLQMILMDRLCVPDVPLEVYSFLNLHLHIVF